MLTAPLHAPTPAPRTAKRAHKLVLPLDAEYHFWRQLAENVAYLRTVQAHAIARQATHDRTPRQLALFEELL